MRIIGRLRGLAIAVVLGLLVACSGEPVDTIRFGLANAPKNFDPRFATDAASSRINRLLYERLVDFNDRAEPVPALADWYAVSPVHYRFTLVPGKHEFHNGTPLTAADIKATYGFILDPDNASPHRTTLALIQSIRVIDDRTIDFYLHRADRLFPAYLAIGIVPEALIDSDAPLNEAPVGSGRLRFIRQPAAGHLVLQRLEDGQQIEFIHVPDPTVRVLKLVRGEIDLLQNDLPAELIGWLETRPEIEVARSNGSNYSYIGFNLNDPVTGQPQVRQAVAHAIDRDAIIRYVLGGHARVAGALFPAEHWAGDDALEGAAYDPERSAQLLSELGYHRGQPLSLTYKTSSDPLRIRLATVIQAQLAKVGIDVSIKSYDWGTFYGDIKRGRFQMYSLAWVGIHTPDIFRYVFHSHSMPPDGANRGRFTDPATDRLIETAERETNRGRQAELYRQLQRHLADAVPYVSLWYEDHIYAARTGIAGYRLAPDGNYDGVETVYRLSDNPLAAVYQ